MRACHVVRRYGPVGGMESYVFHLTRALANLNVDIVVLCEEDLSAIEHPPNLKVQVIGPVSISRPRWKAMRLFRDKAQPLVVELKNEGYLIHSHERVVGHHITTQHGPLMTGSVGIFKRLFSKRIRNWLAFERDELNCQFVLPVSNILMSTIQAHFPKANFGPVVWPGMFDNPVDEDKNVSITQFTFLFVGRDYKRKGLGQAIEIIGSIRKTWPKAELHVYGVSADEIPRRMKRSFVRYFGWEKSIPYYRYVSLLHPAKIEPFGMCVTEALAHGLTCFVSAKTGALEVKAVIPDLPLYQLVSDRDSEQNASLILRSLSEVPENVPKRFLGAAIPWSWDDLALIHLEQIYPQVATDLNKKSVTFGSSAGHCV